MFEFMVYLFFITMIFILAGGFIEMYRNHKKKENQKCNDITTNQ